MSLRDKKAPSHRAAPHGTGLPEGEEKIAAVDRMFDTIAPRYDRLNRILTFGLDIRWRHATVSALELPKGSTVLDVACGTGDLCRNLRNAGYHALGIDRSSGMLANARTTAPLVRGDSLSVPIRSGTLDGIVCGFALRNFADLGTFFGESAKALRPGGRLVCLEVDTPTNPVMRLGHSIYFHRVVPLVGGLLSDRAAYRYLPRSVAYLPAAHELAHQLEDAGFTNVRLQRLSGGIARLLVGTRA